MNIAFVTTYNARSVVNWSGLGYHISKSLENTGNKILYVGELHQNISAINFFKKVFYSKIRHQEYPIDRTIDTAKAYSKTVARCLSEASYDFVFSPGTIPIAYLNTNVPKVIYTDATFACMLGYYKGFANLSPETIRQGHELEKQSLDTCALAIYSSEWAAQSAIYDYSIDPAKVKVVPFGANLEVDYSQEEVSSMIQQRSRSPLKILFNGVDWKRKGGDLVLATVEELIRRGIQVELHIVGAQQLPFTVLPDYIVHHGYLNKQVPLQEAELKALYRNCHFLFLPSDAEAFGIVFSEASANGMPSISKETGGITTAIINGENGYALKPQSNENDYANLILELFLDVEKYNQLALSSYQQYLTRLNWRTAGKEIMKLMEAIK